MKSEINDQTLSDLKTSLNNSVSSSRLLKFAELLIQINKREQVVKINERNNIRNSDSASKT